jgi:hypothetical protein
MKAAFESFNKFCTTQTRVCISQDIYAFVADRGNISFPRTTRCVWTNISGVEQCRRVVSQDEHGTQGLAVFVGTKHLHLCLHFPATTAVCSSPVASGILLPLLLENFQFHLTRHLIVNIAYSTVAKVICFVFLIQWELSSVSSIFIRFLLFQPLLAMYDVYFIWRITFNTNPVEIQQVLLIFKRFPIKTIMNCLYFNQLMHKYISQQYLFIDRILLHVSTSLCHFQGV